jgi:hypothetical protein
MSVTVRVLESLEEETLLVVGMSGVRICTCAYDFNHMHSQHV